MASEKKTFYLGAIDQGTTSTRFIIFNHNVEIVASDQVEHKQIMPKEGWVEHDANEIWEKTVLTMKAALKKAKLTPADLAAVGITNQRETTVVWSKKTGKPLHNALVWMDMRTKEICHKISVSIEF